LQGLQPGEASPFVRSLPSGDFLTTARLMATMDHIITVDTAAAHLAGAIGHPSVHVLVPYNSDWRWWRGPAWYPTLSFYRQREPGDWVVPFAMLREMLRRSL
jgi:ADP-heptose:LPS heptosyltransferase